MPPGMIGHSPELSLPFNLPLARQLLIEAGFLGGKGFPLLRLGIPLKYAGLDEMVYQLEHNLGIRCDVQFNSPNSMMMPLTSGLNLTIFSWIADYPDPDNFLWKSDAIVQLKRLDWHDPAYDRLVEEASRTPDRAKRLEMYHQADRLLVAEQALVLPFYYFLERDLVKPWVKNYRENLLGIFHLHKLIIQDH